MHSSFHYFVTPSYKYTASGFMLELIIIFKVIKFPVLLIKFYKGVEISIFICRLLSILLLLCVGKRDAISGWLAIQLASVASFGLFFLNAATSSHLLPSNHTCTLCQLSYIAR
jgi:hypothetical protein